METVLLLVAVVVLGYVALRLLAAVNDAGSRREVGDPASRPGRRGAFVFGALRAWFRQH